ncbi:hypothetical protein HK405_001621 [Cladochytrium tenue]|nr:hypothetical protein HK405_001621 [Cladochytrium tenue]
MAPRPLSVATAAVAGGTAAAALLVAALWAAWARSSTAVPSEASVPATAASSRELRRRVHRYGNSFPEADVPHYPLLGRAYALTSLHNIAARIGNVFNLEIFVIDSLAAGGTISSCYERINELAIETLASIAKAEAKKGLLGWLGKGDAKGVEVHIFFRRFTFSIICVFIAGADPKQSAQLTTCRTDIETIVAGLGDLVFPTALPFSPFNVGMKTREKVVNILQRLIDNRRARQDAGESFPDLLGNLMNGKMTDGVPMTDTEIIDNVIDILFAGYDTTSALLTTTMHYLTRVVSSTDRTLLQAEIDGLQFPGDMPTEEELQSLPVLDAFLKESLRIKTPINAVFRRAATDTELAGAPVKAGTILLAMNGPTMLDASQFPDPEAFDITRFLPGGPGDVAPTYAYLPFGSGPHMCLGMNLAKLEFKVFIFQLLRRYRVEAGSAPPVPESFPVQMFRSSVHLTERQA